MTDIVNHERKPEPLSSRDIQGLSHARRLLQVLALVRTENRHPTDEEVEMAHSLYYGLEYTSESIQHAMAGSPARTVLGELLSRATSSVTASRAQLDFYEMHHNAGTHEYGQEMKRYLLARADVEAVTRTIYLLTGEVLF
jgi:hypothetical protein